MQRGEKKTWILHSLVLTLGETHRHIPPHHQLKSLIIFTLSFYGVLLPVPQLQWSFLFKGAMGFPEG